MSAGKNLGIFFIILGAFIFFILIIRQLGSCNTASPISFGTFCDITYVEVLTEIIIFILLIGGVILLYQGKNIQQSSQQPIYQPQQPIYQPQQPIYQPQANYGISDSINSANQNITGLQNLYQNSQQLYKSLGFGSKSANAASTAGKSASYLAEAEALAPEAAELALLA